MTARRATGTTAHLWRTASGTALFCVALSSSALAQVEPAPAPVDPMAPAAPPDAPPPADAPPTPGAEQPLPPPAQPTSPAEPAPMAASPLVEEAPPPTPPPPPPADEPADDGKPDPSAGAFAKGTIRLTLLIGTGSSIDDTYLILGAGVGYFLANGLEVGLDYEAWLFAEPVMHRLSPETKYVFHMIPVIKPYVGVFYRRTFITQGFEDVNHVGARAGVFFVPKGGRMFIGGGAVYERLLDCEDNEFLDCDEVYPEISFGVSI